MGAVRGAAPGRHAAAPGRGVPGDHRRTGRTRLARRCRSRPACWAASWLATRCAAASNSRWNCGTSTRTGSCLRRTRPGLVNGYDHPSRLGADRWVALAGARSRVLAAHQARPALVVMVGTAVTVDALDADGRFLGGLILPGFGVMLRALEMGTAGLKVPTGEVVDFPTNTSDALMSGGANAIAGAIERQYRQAAGAHRPGTHALHHRRRGGQADADHRPALRDRGHADLRRPVADAVAPVWRCSRDRGGPDYSQRCSSSRNCRRE